MTPADLRTWRVEAVMTQAESCAAIGVSLSVWQNWEYARTLIPRYVADFCARNPPDDPSLDAFRKRSMSMLRNQHITPTRQQNALAAWHAARAERPEAMSANDLFVWRLAAGLTRRECAIAAWVSTSAWEKWEYERAPLPEYVAAFCLENPPRLGTASFQMPPPAPREWRPRKRRMSPAKREELRDELLLESWQRNSEAGGFPPEELAASPDDPMLAQVSERPERR